MFKILSATASVLFAFTSSAYCQGNNLSKRVMKDNYVGCRQKEAHEKLVKFVVQGDEAGFQSYLRRMIASGQCANMPAGTIFFIEEQSMFGPACVRPQGMDDCLWTLHEAVVP